jgi:VWFA-related protein
MKVTIAQINTTNGDIAVRRPCISSGEHLNSTGLISSLFLIAAFSLLSCPILFGQDAKKTPDRRKSFGQSLKKYEKKPEESADKVTKAETPNDDVIRVETNLVVSDILVVNQKGNALVGLKKEDFVVTENGVPQEMELFSKGGSADIPKSVVLIIEVGVIPSFTDRSLEAAKTLVDKLNPRDRMAIVTTNTKLVLDFTDDKKLLKSKLEKLKDEYRAGRHEYSSLLAALNELFSPEDIRPIVVMQSYGGELSVLKPMWESMKQYCQRLLKGERALWGFCERDYSFSDVMEAVEKSRATIYTIVPGPQIVGLSKEQQIRRSHLYLNGYMNEIAKGIERSEKQKEELRRKLTETEIQEHTATQTALIKVTGLSGGYTNFLEKAEDASGIYESIFKVIENRYVIGYYPKNEARDGKRRSVKIEVRGHPEYIVMGRKTYFAPESKK